MELLIFFNGVCFLICCSSINDIDVSSDSQMSKSGQEVFTQETVMSLNTEHQTEPEIQSAPTLTLQQVH